MTYRAGWTVRKYQRFSVGLQRVVSMQLIMWPDNELDESARSLLKTQEGIGGNSLGYICIRLMAIDDDTKLRALFRDIIDH